MASNHATMRDRVHTVIQGLTFTGGPASANIVTRKVPIDRSLTLPGIVVCAYGQERYRWQRNVKVQIGYPIAVVLHEASNQTATADDTELTWRQTIVSAFLMKGGSVVTGCSACEVEFGPIIDLQGWQQANLALSFLTIICWVEVTRS